MEFVELTEQEYGEFWKIAEERNFLNRPEILRHQEFYRKFFFGVKNEGKLVMAGMVRGNRRKMGMVDFYMPMGPISLGMGFEKSEREKYFATLGFFLKSLKRKLRGERGFRLRIDPNIEKIERDIDGKIVENGRNNEDFVEFLTKNGLKRRPYVESVSQVTWEFRKPLNREVTDEMLMAQMKGNTRRRLKQALELGMEIKRLKREELPEFFEIMRDTAERREFEARDDEYFYKMYDLFGKDVEFVSVVINPKKTYEKLLAKRKEIFGFSGGTIRERQDNEDAKKSIETRIDKFEENFEGIKENPEEFDREITLSSGMFFTCGKEIVHLFGGNKSEYMKLDAQYVLQWEMIREARDMGKEWYNFYGIAENIDKHPEGYSVYEFKRGFSGVVWERLGEYEMSLIPFLR